MGAKGGYEEDEVETGQRHGEGWSRGRGTAEGGDCSVIIICHKDIRHLTASLLYKMSKSFPRRFHINLRISHLCRCSRAMPVPLPSRYPASRWPAAPLRASRWSSAADTTDRTAPPMRVIRSAHTSDTLRPHERHAPPTRAIRSAHPSDTLGVSVWHLFIFPHTARPRCPPRLKNYTRGR